MRGDREISGRPEPREPRASHAPAVRAVAGASQHAFDSNNAFSFLFRRQRHHGVCPLAFNSTPRDPGPVHATHSVRAARVRLVCPLVYPQAYIRFGTVHSVERPARSNQSYDTDRQEGKSTNEMRRKGGYLAKTTGATKSRKGRAGRVGAPTGRRVLLDVAYGLGAASVCATFGGMANNKAFRHLGESFVHFFSLVSCQLAGDQKT